ncbi:hypothetical protein PYCCODRAFT_1531337 [Trametes coccinea BRFM310]|uniref:Uncharacterized protein n=1 Tax=Trametes coccinea (strain BRFM310) TaxID=1353009 RepID=A0A1Y2I7F5_TRAC3|nr:hypothetical protein PYCCODRAFT_1531337 [Trametes coccinea BRFM310]
MCALLHFLMDRNSPEHTVERSVDSIRMQPSWPDTLRDKPRSHHVEYAWMLFTGLLAVNILSPHLQPTPPPTFAGIVERIFPPLADATAKPLHSSSTARNLLEDGLDIQPTSNVLDHLKLVGNTVSVYMLSAEEIQLLMGYKHNRAARVIGIANLGEESCIHTSRSWRASSTNTTASPFRLGSSRSRTTTSAQTPVSMAT